jgi:integral membrane protein
MIAEWLLLGQPPVSQATVDKAARPLTRYRIMAFATGIVLVSATIALILQAAGVAHMKGVNEVLWIGHGYFYLIYVMVAAVLGVRMRWPLPRYALVMLAGTVPTMSFVAEHFITRSVRTAAVAETPQPVPLRD